MFIAKLLAVVLAPKVAGNCPEIVERVVLPVVCNAEVAAPVGKGRDAALTGTADWSEAIATGWDADIVVWPSAAGIPPADTGTALWLLAITTGEELAIVAWPFALFGLYAILDYLPI